jgi:predicted Zn-ribbon and HTH transcriptional regulator
MDLKELTEDFEILIVAWLKSDDENATNLAYSLAKYALKKQLPIHGVVGRSEQLPCGHKQVELVRHAAKCKDCGTVFETKNLKLRIMLNKSNNLNKPHNSVITYILCYV